MNYTSTPVETLARVLGHAEHCGLSVIKEQRKNWHESRVQGKDVFEEITRNPHPSEFHVLAMFPQTWGSTSLGFEGIGGSAICTAYTTVIESSYNGEVLVYFGERFAYRVSNPNEQFFTDLANRDLGTISKADSYERRRTLNGQTT